MIKMKTAKLRPGDRVIVTRGEHEGKLAYVRAVRWTTVGSGTRFGDVIIKLGPNPDGSGRVVGVRRDSVRRWP